MKNAQVKITLDRGVLQVTKVDGASAQVRTDIFIVI